MGLITFLLLAAFSLLYVSKSWQNKPEFVNKAVTMISENLNILAIAGVVYGLLVAFLTPIVIYAPNDMFVRLVANILLVIMALPYCFERVATKYEEKINKAILDETRGFITAILKYEKYIGIAGAVVSLLLFAVVFR